MKSKTQSSSPESQVQNFSAEQNTELWEPPFDRWMRLTDDLLRDWPNPAAQNPEQRL